MISVENVNYIYKSRGVDDQDTKALHHLSLEVKQGEFIVLLGRNGSGKSTFAQLLNALLLPTQGAVYIRGLNTKNEQYTWEIRRSAGMVFQNPDNQIIGTIVEEDVAFGPENMGVEASEIRKRVDEAMEAVGITEFKKQAPHLLSGGQKQRVAIAGILAMKPECIILDEATSMLDPLGREEVLHILKKLNMEDKITIIHITHLMEEAIRADRIYVFDQGEIMMEGTPKDIFSRVKELKQVGLEVPQVTELFYELNQEGMKLPLDVLTVEDAFENLKHL
jgi:energy-coupling factor transport system ATP-binding protein